jgi:hypothetical protein
MKLVQLQWTKAPADLARFEEAVRQQLAGAARRKASGCRAGQYVVREAALPAFRQLAAAHHLEVYAYAPEELERPGRPVR